MGKIVYEDLGCYIESVEGDLEVSVKEVVINNPWFVIDQVKREKFYELLNRVTTDSDSEDVP